MGLLGQPLIASVLGLAIGVGLFELSRYGASFFTAEDPWLGMARTLVLNAGSMAAALVALTLYFMFVRPGLPYFGAFLAGGFMFMALVALFRFAGPKKATFGGGR